MSAARCGWTQRNLYVRPKGEHAYRVLSPAPNKTDHFDTKAI